jgi:hypothetical protein
MSTLQQEFDAFTAFVRQRIGGASDATIDDLYDQWREARPASEDALAIKASLADMENGETGRPFGEFVADFRKRNRIAEN